MSELNGLWELPHDQLIALRSGDFAVTRQITTRWRDNDAFGHANNAVYYEYFDTAINTWLLDCAAAREDTAVAPRVVAESRCRYLRELAFPGTVTIAVQTVRQGTTSVTFDLAIFDAADTPVTAIGRWTHVFVDPVTRKPVPIPAAVSVDLAAARSSKEKS